MLHDFSINALLSTADRGPLVGRYAAV